MAAATDEADLIGDAGEVAEQLGQHHAALGVKQDRLGRGVAQAAIQPLQVYDGLGHAMPDPLRQALGVMQRLATSPAADPSLSVAREDDARLAFEAVQSAFMVNYTFVWPSVQANAPAVAAHMDWSRWPAVVQGMPSRVTLLCFQARNSSMLNFTALSG